MEFFEPIECGSWEELLGQLEKLESGWLFRGERNAAWVPSTSLERHTPTARTRSDAERMLLEEFRRRAHLHVAAHHTPADVIEWLALLQHWGGPTRFLDFTASPYVAAYFAVEDAVERDGFCAVWAVDKHAIWRCSGKVLATQGALHPSALEDDEFHRTLGFLAGRVAALFDKVVWSNKCDCVVEVVPGKFSERLSVQQGVFLCPANVNKPFIENLAATALPYGYVKRLILSNRHQGRALERLRAMNITRATLFPGLEGLAQSFRQLLINEPEEEKRARQHMRDVLDGLRQATEGRQNAEADQ